MGTPRARRCCGLFVRCPARARARTAIYADTYGDAAALDFFGPRYGLPPAISAKNSYYLWGTHNYDGRLMIAIGATHAALLRKYYRRVRLVRTSTEPLKWVVEGPAPIFLCRDPVAPLSTFGRGCDGTARKVEPAGGRALAACVGNANADTRCWKWSLPSPLSRCC